MSQDVESLESQLQEKEALVAALTERLEEAAEQLDRIHRTGGDRGMKIAGGIPVELVEQQKTLTEDLHRAVEQWEELQLAGSLGRLEMQLSELRDLVAGKALDGGNMAAMLGGAQTHGGPQAAQRTSDADTEQEEGQGSSWEALKAELMEGDEDGADGSDSPNTADVDHESELAESLNDIDHVDPPIPVDLEDAEAADLHQAIRSRDDYIAYLLKRLRIFESHRGPRIDWQSLDNAPEELRTRLEELEAHFEEKLRRAEVEHSLERARLGREEARLRTLEENARRQLKRMGVSLDGEDAEEVHDEESEKSGRWLRMLGLKKEDD